MRGLARSDPGTGALSLLEEKGGVEKLSFSSLLLCYHGFPEGSDWQGGAWWGGSSSLTK